MGVVIPIWFLWSLILSIIMIVRVKNHKVVKRPKLVLYLNIINLLALTLWVLLMFIVWQSRDGLATLLWYLIISIPILVINIVQYRRGYYVKEISPGELYELYENTLHQCGSNIFNYPDDIVEMMVFEDFDIGVHSFLHDDSLNTLFNNHLINKKQYDLSRRIRELFLEIEDCGELTMECLKGKSEKWKHLISLVDEAVSIL